MRLFVLYFVLFFFFKQKTAYEMLRSLVGSEMCIRDSPIAGALGVVPEEDRHRRHRLGDHQLTYLSLHGVSLVVVRLHFGAEGAALQLSLADRQQRAAGDERRAHVGAAADRANQAVGLDVLVKPAEPPVSYTH